MLEAIRNAFRLPDLRRRILITILLLVIYRLAANIPVPGVSKDALNQLLSGPGGLATFANVLDLLSGGAVASFSVLAMGVYPYITASIIIQLLVPIIPALEELQKQGQQGRDTLNRYTYFLSIPMAALQAIGQINIFGSGRGGAIIPGFGAEDPLLTATVIATMTAGTMFAIWLGELVTEEGIGNGISLVIFAGIVARVPFNMARLLADEANRMRNLLIFLALTVITVTVIVVVQEGTRRIPVKYGKRVRGTKMYGGGTTYLPLKVNTAGMIPLIFAQSFLTFPAILANFFINSSTPFIANLSNSISTIFGSQGGALLGPQLIYWITYFLMVVGFTYFYTDVMIQNQNLPENLQKQGGFIPGIRPGPRTEEFIKRVVRRITLVGALFLGGVAILPGVVQIILELIQPGAGVVAGRSLLIISGGGLIIVVGVVIDTMRQLEAQLVMRHRESFIR